MKVARAAKAAAMTEHGRFSGLTAQDTAARLIDEGPNALPRAGQQFVLRFALDVLREPMLALLLAGGGWWHTCCLAIWPRP